jgi:hypothetical protein
MASGYIRALLERELTPVRKTSIREAAMFFDHEYLKTWDERCAMAVRGMPPQHQAQLDAKAHAAGCSVQELLEACLMAHFRDGGNAVLPYFEWAQQPYGKDPPADQAGAMTVKQFRRPANGHSRTALVNGRVVGGRGFRLMSKIGQHAISLNRLEQLLAEAQPRGKRTPP